MKGVMRTSAVAQIQFASTPNGARVMYHRRSHHTAWTCRARSVNSRQS